MLDIVAHHLSGKGISHSVIQGNIPAKKRMDLVDDFNMNPDGVQVGSDFGTSFKQHVEMYGQI